MSIIADGQVFTYEGRTKIQPEEATCPQGAMCLRQQLKALVNRLWVY